MHPEGVLFGIFVGFVATGLIILLFVFPVLTASAEKRGACAERGGAVQGSVCVVDSRVVELRYSEKE
jgi:hypothetical protein